MQVPHTNECEEPHCSLCKIWAVYQQHLCKAAARQQEEALRAALARDTSETLPRHSRDTSETLPSGAVMLADSKKFSRGYVIRSSLLD